MKKKPSKISSFLLHWVLSCVVFIVYHKILNNEFINFDDPIYILNNSNISNGISLSSIKWAFSSIECSNWHPLTWLSHILDCQLYGLEPFGHHLTSLLIHIANTSLLFYLLKRIKFSLWESFFIALLFGIHPIHVESLAWISERKDVLCAFFFFLTIISYSFYIESTAKSKSIKYALSLIFFAMTLMSKPMGITLPAVFILLDIFPLKRFTFCSAKSCAEIIKMLFRKENIKIFLEKLPFFLLSAISATITVYVQNAGGAIKSLNKIPFDIRILNAFIAYCSYLGKIFYPNNLAVFYPYYAGEINTFNAYLSFIGISIFSLIVIYMFFKKKQILFTAWFWFLGMLVPVIGLVQVGVQSMADRYLYLPAIGIYIIVVSTVSSLQNRFTKDYLILLFIPICLILGYMTVIQTSKWESSKTLFTHALKVTKKNHVAYNNLACDQMDSDLKTSLLNLKKSIEFYPSNKNAIFNIAMVYLKLNKLNYALVFFKESILTNPKNASAYSGLGNTYLRQEKYKDAIANFLVAIKLDSSDIGSYHNLAEIYQRQHLYKKAILYYKEVIKINPNYFNTLYNYASANIALKNYKDAESALKHYIKLRPINVKALNNLAYIYLSTKKYLLAKKYFYNAIKISPNDPELYDNYAQAMFYLHDRTAALSNFRKGLKLAEEQENNALAITIKKHIYLVLK